MEKSTISYVLSIIGLILVLVACSHSQPVPQDTPSEPLAESVVMNDTLSTLAIESSNELTFLSPISPRWGVYALLRADIPISIEFFAVENGQVSPTPLGPSLSTANGSIRVNNSRPRYSNYSANWNTALSNRSNGDVVRVEVRLPQAPTGAPVCANGIDKAKGCLGFFDVQLWDSSWDVFYRRWFQYDNILDIRNRWMLPIKFHIAQGTDIPTTNPDTNVAPTLTISAPSNNASFTTNDNITLTASANDAEDGNISNSIQWSSDNFSGTIPKGGTVQLGKLPAGSYTFTARVADSKGATAQATVRFTVTQAANNTAPTLSITSPNNTSSLTTNDTITLVAQANDAEDGNLSNSIQWSSDNFSGTIPQGGSAQIGKLSAGTYTFTARVSDSQGATAQATVTFTVRAAATNTAPTLTITSPNNTSSLTTNDTITLAAQANDAEDGNLSNSIQWSSNDFSGTIPQGGSAEIGKLSAGTYTFTARVSDSQGATAQATVTFTVTAAATNTAPTLTITSPNNTSSLTTNDSITLTAQANDAEDGNLSNNIQWSSDNFSGTIPKGGSAEIGKLAAGTYTFKARVADSQGAAAEATVTFIVRDATATNSKPVFSTLTTSPSIGRFSPEDNITLVARATDAEDGDITRNIQWSSSDISGTLPKGGVVTVGKLAPGVYTFKARVTDSAGASTESRLSLRVNATTLTVLSPRAKRTFTTNDFMILEVTAQDTQDGNLASKVKWRVQQGYKGTLPQGARIELGKLPVGYYVFIVSVTNSRNETVSTRITFSISPSLSTNTPPYLRIINPGNNAAFTSNDSITLVAKANDNQDGNISSNVQWSSNDFTGTIPKGGTVSLGKLAAGSYTFTAKITDSNGATDEKSVRFGVVGNSAPNTPPTLTITSPKQGDSLTIRDRIILAATANDAQDGDITAKIQWVAIQGFTGRIDPGAQVSLGALSPGTYIFEARVTDSQGATATSRITFPIVAP